MISVCPHCGRDVASEENLIHTDRFGWVPSLCCTGENGPLPSGCYENVANHPFWYVYARNDGGAQVLVAGPYRSYLEALSNRFWAIRMAGIYDVRAPWYSYGIASGCSVIKTRFGTVV
jgi:hypothetical protein